MSKSNWDGITVDRFGNPIVETARQFGILFPNFVDLTFQTTIMIQVWDDGRSVPRRNPTSRDDLPKISNYDNPNGVGYAREHLCYVQAKAGASCGWALNAIPFNETYEIRGHVILRELATEESLVNLRRSFTSFLGSG